MNDINEYLANLEPKVARLLALIQNYKAAERNDEELIRYKKALEKEESLRRYKETIKKGSTLSNEQTRLKRLLESCHKQYEYEETVMGDSGKVYISISDPEAGADEKAFR
jgi:outer membrane protein assembly factor BamD (BamD/ComL family)